MHASVTGRGRRLLLLIRSVVKWVVTVASSGADVALSCRQAPIKRDAASHLELKAALIDASA